MRVFQCDMFNIYEIKLNSYKYIDRICGLKGDISLCLKNKFKLDNIMLIFPIYYYQDIFINNTCIIRKYIVGKLICKDIHINKRYRLFYGKLIDYSDTDLDERVNYIKYPILELLNKS